MDQDYEHDPHENDLLEFFRHFGAWWERHGRNTLIVLLIVAGTFAAWRWVSFNRQTSHEESWSALTASTSPESYLAAATEIPDPAARNLARLRGADLAAQEAARPQAAEDAERPERSPDNLLAQAKTAYQEVLADADAHVIFRLNAMLGLAAVAESRRQWDDARTWYDKLEAAAGDLYPAHRDQAEQRRDDLERLAEPLTFAPDEAPDEPDAASPAEGDEGEADPADPTDATDPTEKVGGDDAVAQPAADGP